MARQNIWRHLYSAVFYVTLPLIILRLLWRSRHNPGYRQNLLQRFGSTNFKLTESIWLHAVSLGEAKIAHAIATKLRTIYPDMPIVISTTTLTGAQYINNIKLEQLYHSYCPYDLTNNWQRFLRAIKPVMLIIIETELWPNLLAMCHNKQIPVLIANARISPRSFKRYQRIFCYSQVMLSWLSLVMAQSTADGERFLALGLHKDQLAIAGNIKFDLSIPKNLGTIRPQLGVNRAIWIAASTHAGEESIILTAHQAILATNSTALLIIAPRHPERFNVVAKLIKKHHLKMVTRSSKQLCDPSTQVYLADSLGELYLLYNSSDVAFVGGSLVAIGGHNLLEPAALAKPLLSGPMLNNFQDIAQTFSKNQALTIVTDARSLALAVIKLFTEPQLSQEQGAKAWQVVQSNNGALEQHISLIIAIYNNHNAYHKAAKQ
jgi:3-deoxy-D-manno-octulosonic-acid transferase